MDINVFRGIITAVLLASFIGLWVWAWSARRRTDFHEAANLPFRDETDSNKGDAQ